MTVLTRDELRELHKHSFDSILKIHQETVRETHNFIYLYSYSHNLIPFRGYYFVKKQNKLPLDKPHHYETCNFENLSKKLSEVRVQELAIDDILLVDEFSRLILFQDTASKEEESLFQRKISSYGSWYRWRVEKLPEGYLARDKVIASIFHDFTFINPPQSCCNLL